MIEGRRVFRCAFCNEEVCVCRTCDHGQLYCAGDCFEIRRRASVRRAGAKYQRSRRGALKHAARQAQLRASKLSAQKVTHHGFPTAPQSIIVTTSVHVAGAHADTEDRYGAVVDDVADWQGLEAACDESGGRRPDQGAAPDPASASACALDDARGDRGLQWRAALRCDFCGRPPRRLARLRAVVRGPVARREPAGSVRLRAPRAARARRRIRGVGDFRDVRRHLRLVRSR